STQNKIEAKIKNYKQTLNELATTFTATKEEVDVLKETYYLEYNDMERYLSLEKSLNQLSNQLHEVLENVENENESHTALRKQIEKGFEQLAELEHQHNEFKLQIDNLRKDELEAKETLLEMREEINRIKRKIKKSNIPGVPTYIWSLIETSMDKSAQAIKTLDKKPLDIAEVQAALNEVKTAVNNASENTD